MALFKILRGNDSSKLIKSDGTINPEVKWNDGYAYFCTDTHDFYIDYEDSNKTKVRAKLNSHQADKLKNKRTIGVGTAVTSTETGFDGSSNITIPINSVKESYLTWGGKNFSGSYGPLDAAMIPALGTNRFAFGKKEGITTEYSRDGGNTWENYALTNEAKVKLFSGLSSSLRIGGSDSTYTEKSNWRVRVTIKSDSFGLYTELNKFAILCSTEGSQNCWCSISGRTKTNVDSGNETWKAIAEQVPITGWSGWNIINTNAITCGTQSPSIHYNELRFEFGVGSHPATSQYKGLSIMKIMGFGGVGWSTPSTMASNGNLYSYDYQQKVTFPNSITQNSTSGQIYSKGTLKVDGATTLTGAVTSGTLTASSLKSNGTLTVNGKTTLKETATGALTASSLSSNGTLTVNGKTTLKETATGALTASSLSSTGALSVTGNSTLTGSLTVKGNTVLGDNISNTVTASGTVEANNFEAPQLNITGGLNSAGDRYTSYLPYNTKINYQADADSTADNPSLDVFGWLSVDSLHLYEGATIERDLDVGGTLYADEVDTRYIELVETNGAHYTDITPYGISSVDSTTMENAYFNTTSIWLGDMMAEKYHAGIEENGIQYINCQTDQAAGLYPDGSVQATDYMEAPVFIGDLTGVANESYSLTWAYFDADGVIS